MFFVFLFLLPIHSLKEFAIYETSYLKFFKSPSMRILSRELMLYHFCPPHKYNARFCNVNICWSCAEHRNGSQKKISNERKCILWSLAILSMNSKYSSYTKQPLWLWRMHIWFVTRYRSKNKMKFIEKLTMWFDQTETRKMRENLLLSVHMNEIFLIIYIVEAFDFSE